MQVVHMGHAGRGPEATCWLKTDVPKALLNANTVRRGEVTNTPRPAARRPIHRTEDEEMENNSPSRLSAVWFALCAVLLSGSPCVAQLGVEGRDWDRDMDRPGMDYKRIDGQWNPDACHWACQWDPACKAWTSCLTSPQTGSCWLSQCPEVRKGMCFSD
jgi:hypothetical protein